MKKRELIFFLPAVLLILALFFGERLDRMLLPEYRFPHYEKLLSQRALSQYFLSDPGASSENLFIVDTQSRSFGDLHMQVEGDGTILLFGKNGEQDLTIPLSVRTDLSDGEYRFTDGGATVPGLVTVYGTAGGTAGTEPGLMAMPDYPVFSVDRSKYQEYWFGFWVKAGAELPPTRFLPLLKRADQDMRSYSPARISQPGKFRAYPYLIRELTEEELGSLSPADWELFCRNLRFQYKNHYLWVSLRLPDGRGVQFLRGDPELSRIGEMDDWGRVREAEQSFRFTGKEAPLQAKQR